MNFSNNPNIPASEAINEKERGKLRTSEVSLLNTLEKIRISSKREGTIGAIIQDWEKIAGSNLAPNCFPINLRQKVLTIGANHPQWRQALFYNRLQLIASLKSAGHKVTDIRIKQYYPPKRINIPSEKDLWNNHPSRIDVHGTEICISCGKPAPKGELELWGKCSFCRIKELI